MVIEGHAAHKYNFTRGPFAPRSDGRLSSASKKLIQLGRESFLRETDHLLEIADVLYRAKQVMESHLDMGLTFEEALDVATLPPKQRGARITQYKNQKARA